jgi:phosphatidylserine/phosphatidylglycerophosphate/cardiolipin synthase-like enzyme
MEVRALWDDYGFDIRLLSKKHFVHCHNQLIIVDDETVLISSQNWSDSAVAKNREAGLIIYDKDITHYFSRIFNTDWIMSDHETEEVVAGNATIALESLAQLPGKYVLLDTSDIQEV